MPRRRDRCFIDALERWSPRAATPRAAPAAFVTIARNFEQIDRVMLDEILADIRRNALLPCRFKDIQDKNVTSYIQDLQRGTSHTSSEADVSAYLSDYDCITAWGWVHSAMLEDQGKSSNEHRLLPWIQAKSRANEILDLARAVLETYDSDECRDLLVPGRESVGAGVEAKLRKLCSFNTIYSRPTYEIERGQNVPLHHSFYVLFNQFFADRRENIKAKRKAHHIKAHQNVSKHSA